MKFLHDRTDIEHHALDNIDTLAIGFAQKAQKRKRNHGNGNGKRSQIN